LERTTFVKLDDGQFFIRLANRPVVIRIAALAGCQQDQAGQHKRRDQQGSPRGELRFQSFELERLEH
jgi:hypothetical protein